MKNLFTVLRVIISIIALLIFACVVVLTVMGGYNIVMTFYHLNEENMGAYMAIGLLHAVDLFLVAVVFFVLSLGLNILFLPANDDLPIQLPEWLKIRNFVQLKIILWEAILTTLVVSYLAALVEREINKVEKTIQDLIVPGAILLIALSLYFMKKEEKH